MSGGEAPPPDAPAASPWSPLRNGLFRALWIATIVSNVGTWMQDVGAGWLMTSLSSSPSLVALVEAADSIPVMLLAMPAGALADIVDRRRLLIARADLPAASSPALLGVLTYFDLTTAWVLLGFTFALGVGTAMMMPAWSAIVPELVPPGRAAVGGRAEQHRDQRVARDRAGDRRRPGRGGRRVARVRAERAVLHRHPRRADRAGGASIARARCRPSDS